LECCCQHRHHPILCVGETDIFRDGGDVSELNFKGKEFVYNHHLAVPFRPLEPHAKKGIGAVALDGNLIIHGDNLHALKALLPIYAGKVDCVFIDPPYNTGNEGWMPRRMGEFLKQFGAAAFIRRMLDEKVRGRTVGRGNRKTTFSAKWDPPGGSDAQCERPIRYT